MKGTQFIIFSRDEEYPNVHQDYFHCLPLYSILMLLHLLPKNGSIKILNARPKSKKVTDRKLGE